MTSPVCHTFAQPKHLDSEGKFNCEVRESTKNCLVIASVKQFAGRTVQKHLRIEIVTFTEVTIQIFIRALGAK